MRRTDDTNYSEIEENKDDYSKPAGIAYALRYLYNDISDDNDIIEKAWKSVPSLLDKDVIEKNETDKQ